VSSKRENVADSRESRDGYECSECGVEMRHEGLLCEECISRLTRKKHKHAGEIKSFNDEDDNEGYTE
jgi:predicted amidophosphoribosyltransferase